MLELHRSLFDAGTRGVLVAERTLLEPFGMNSIDMLDPAMISLATSVHDIGSHAIDNGVYGYCQSFAW